MSSVLQTAQRTALLGLWLVLAAGSTGRAADDGFVSIFDGQSLAQWDGNPQFWKVVEGTITGQTTPDNPTRGNTFLIWRGGEVEDFELKLEYRIVGGNSGIQYRSFENGDWGRWVVGGYQADFEAGDHFSGILYGERFRGILAARGQKTVIGPDHKPRVVGSVGDPQKLGAVIKKEKWNEYHITAEGFHFVHRINGQVMCEVTDEDVAVRRRSGILAVQLHAGPPMLVQFRNIRLKRLSPAGKKVALISGNPSHGFGAHEHYAGCVLLAQALNASGTGIRATVYKHGWPKDPAELAEADAIVIYSDGGDGHLVNRRLDEVDALLKKGTGLVCIHYAVEVPKGPPGDRFLEWIGGYFETFWSVNPHWTAQFQALPDHPICRGVRPFSINDEWYYHMRFRPGMSGVAPILSAVPPDETRKRAWGTARGGNPQVLQRRGQAEHVAWAYERPNGGRGFGFTGGHVHWNWGNDNFRKLVLNAIVWAAGAEVPAKGVPSASLTVADLEANQDFPRPKDYDPRRIEKLLQDWNRQTARSAAAETGSARAARD